MSSLSYAQTNTARDTLIKNPNYDKAIALLQTDLAIKNELLDYDIYTWFGSAALPEYLPASDKIWKTNP